MNEWVIIAIAGVIIVQQGYIFLAERRHERERKDLLNRIMAKDTSEYIEVTSGNADKKPRNRIIDSQRADLIKQGYLRE